MKAAIAIDDWKLSIFQRHLDQCAYKFTQGPGLTSGTLLLMVQTTNLEALAVVVGAANAEAAKTGAPK